MRTERKRAEEEDGVKTYTFILSSLDSKKKYICIQAELRSCGEEGPH